MSHKILISPDVHFCRCSSIIQSRGEFYTTRLENCIKSLNWVEQISTQYDCSSVFYLGDFFDKNNINAEEATALTEVHFNTDIPHFFVTGNHEISLTSNEYASNMLFNMLPNSQAINKITDLADDKVIIHCIPYLYDCPEDITEVVDFSDKTKTHLVISHNDIKGIQMGGFVSVSGFSIESIEQNCDLFINGHIHNGQWVSQKILNLGLLTGQNFNEDAFVYKHDIIILDLDEKNIEFIENPYAFNFYKIEIAERSDLGILSSLKDNSVISVKCPESLTDEVKTLVKNNTNIVESRITICKDKTLTEEVAVETFILSVDHLAELTKFALSRIGDDDILREELMEICK